MRETVQNVGTQAVMASFHLTLRGFIIYHIEQQRLSEYLILLRLNLNLYLLGVYNVS